MVLLLNSISFDFNVILPILFSSLEQRHGIVGTRTDICIVCVFINTFLVLRRRFISVTSLRWFVLLANFRTLRFPRGCLGRLGCRLGGRLGGLGR